MNTVANILELQKTGRIILERTGFGMTEKGKQFSEWIKELISRTFFAFCIEEKEQSNLTRDQLPPLQEMCDSLGGIEQSRSLTKFAQQAYYCAVAFLLMMEGGDDEDVRGIQAMRADMLMNSGLLPN